MPTHVPQRGSTEQQQRAADLAQRDVARRRWEEQRAHGRTAFIWRNGVLGWGLPAAVLTALYKLIQDQGLVLSPILTPTLRNALVLIVVVFPVLGWLFGGWLWERGEERHARLREDARWPEDGR